MTSYWLVTNHTVVLHGLMAVAAVCYALMFRDNRAGSPGPVMTTTPQPRRRVREVWFGEHVIADYNAEAASAECYVHAMSGRFAGPRVTNDPSPSAPPASRGGS